ncbi:MAG: periplasmic divalent cation tolerance protein [Planctomycetota bacterium]|jgi:periplasmic divalent cation tolerance protein
MADPGGADSRTLGDPTSDEVVVVLVTVPVDHSESLARAVVEEGLCACVNVVPAVRSFFRWQGKVESADEHLLAIKTTTAAFELLQDRVVALHPYDVPEVIALPVAAGLPAYLSWVVESVRP